MSQLAKALIVTFAVSLALPLAGCDDDSPEYTSSQDAGTDLVADGGNNVGPDVADRPDVDIDSRTTNPTCDNERSTADPNAPDTGEDWIACTTHEECTEGINGRCVGNGHDGWYCTYDECFEDSECGGFVCQCGGGFRSDHNICLREGNCLTDADCPDGGVCSPTLGSCGDYSGTVGYYCHTNLDECTVDADCDGEWSYCAFNTMTGRWTCSDSQCAG